MSEKSSLRLHLLRRRRAATPLRTRVSEAHKLLENRPLSNNAYEAWKLKTAASVSQAFGRTSTELRRFEQAIDSDGVKAYARGVEWLEDEAAAICKPL